MAVPFVVWYSPSFPNKDPSSFRVMEILAVVKTINILRITIVAIIVFVGVATGIVCVNTVQSASKSAMIHPQTTATMTNPVLHAALLCASCVSCEASSATQPAAFLHLAKGGWNTAFISRRESLKWLSRQLGV